jgi:hypothetical protein
MIALVSVTEVISSFMFVEALSTVKFKASVYTVVAFGSSLLRDIWHQVEFVPIKGLEASAPCAHWIFGGSTKTGICAV